ITRFAEALPFEVDAMASDRGCHTAIADLHRVHTIVGE
ncbi:MAG: hypothetical protein RL254_202, partial [Planctomycetota bacterium]